MTVLDISRHLFLFLIDVGWLHFRELLDLFEISMQSDFHWLYTNISLLVVWHLLD